MRTILLVGTLLSANAGDGDTQGLESDAAVHVVLFTHIEDSAPAGALGTMQCRTSYVGLRSKLIEVAQRAAAHDLPWTLQPDWKMLEAALIYEDAATTASTGGKSFLRYLHEDFI